MIKKNEISYLFIGPSSYAIQLDIPSNMKVMPPAKRGDIENLMVEYPPGTVVLVDGTYHSYPAVSHAEIRTAIEAGWTFWGLSSMGAIRAVELAPVGMKGYGEVYRMFSGNDDLPDDYVALIHGNEAPYIPISEPLVHIDFFLKDLVKEKIITHEVYVELLQYLFNMWFGYRTLKTVKKILIDHVAEADLSTLNGKVNNFQHYRVKNLDVLSFLSKCEN
ncbi:TfuA-like protein [Prodigiosinella aquatilis]|nr:TfuA-like protein [Prodigiosinella sp. LS101]WJV53223.1 TfuA-like protein [Prodigiosinella sp. LS101]WJV57583.1 TfuA-like protein [Pectobacteriaceae bacterium C111]